MGASGRPPSAKSVPRHCRRSLVGVTDVGDGRRGARAASREDPDARQGVTEVRRTSVRAMRLSSGPRWRSMATEANRLGRIRSLLVAHGVGDDVIAQVQAELRAVALERADIDRQFRALATVGWDGIIVSVDGVFIDVDDGWLALFGKSRADVVGRFPTEVLTPESLVEVLERIRTGDER